MRELSLNVMDIVQNSISAGATVIKISVLEEAQKLTIVVTDNGKGMSKEQVCKVIDPFSLPPEQPGKLVWVSRFLKWKQR